MNDVNFGASQPSADIPSPEVSGNTDSPQGYVYVIMAESDPDKGGSAVAMAKLTEARRKLKERAA
jgi:hypothetical protein